MTPFSTIKKRKPTATCPHCNGTRRTPGSVTRRCVRCQAGKVIEISAVERENLEQARARMERRIALLNRNLTRLQNRHRDLFMFLNACATETVETTKR